MDILKRRLQILEKARNKGQITQFKIKISKNISFFGLICIFSTGRKSLKIKLLVDILTGRQIIWSLVSPNSLIRFAMIGYSNQ